MPQRSSKQRTSSRRRDKNKLTNYAATIFHEVKRYDGDGNLIETISPDELIARPIGASRKWHTLSRKQSRGAQLTKTNGEGSKKDWAKVTAAVKKGAKVGYRKEHI